MIRPEVSIGLVVRNGQRHLTSALESIVAQTFLDFELTIYDNHSTDDTGVIARRFASLDDRITYIRHPHDKGIVANFVIALESASSPFFCWAACDDLRDPRFLETLVSLLRRYPDADLASCPAADLAPDGTERGTRFDTDGVRRHQHRGKGGQLLPYLRDLPCSLFYGLFRTEAAREHLPVLEEMVTPRNVIPLGGDAVFLTSFLSRRRVVMSDEVLFYFRSGGISHRVDIHDSLRECCHQSALFFSRMASAVRGVEHNLHRRLRVHPALVIFMLRFLFSKPLRLMLLHHLTSELPGLRRSTDFWMMSFHRPYRRLRRRARDLPPGSRVVLLGAGKHTRRCRGLIDTALAPNASVVAICDDAALDQESLDGLNITPPASIADLAPDLVLVSSDAYEPALMQRALTVVPDETLVWCIYDLALERPMERAGTSHSPSPARSASSTDSIKSAI